MRMRASAVGLVLSVVYSCTLFYFPDRMYRSVRLKKIDIKLEEIQKNPVTLIQGHYAAPQRDTTTFQSATTEIRRNESCADFLI